MIAPSFSSSTTAQFSKRAFCTLVANIASGTATKMNNRRRDLSEKRRDNHLRNTSEFLLDRPTIGIADAVVHDNVTRLTTS